MPPERETLEVDVLFVGGGPASLSGALRLAQLIRARGLTPAPTIVVLEKGRELGNHNLSGALLDPGALAELVPDYAARAPLEAPVTSEQVHWLLDAGRAVRLPGPVIPPLMRNRGCSVVSVSRLTRWLGEEAAAAGVQLLPGTAASDLLVEQDRVVGVRTADAGLDKQGQRKPNFQPGINIRATVTVFGEGPKGTLAEQVIQRFGLRARALPPMYSLGVKEVIELPGHPLAGQVLHTLGYPLPLDTFGGGFLYGMQAPYLSVGFVVGIDWVDPRTDPQRLLQQWKLHPVVHRLLKGGRVVEFGARMIPEGGYYAVPIPAAPGALLIGDAIGLVNVPRLKGIHLAMRSGMLAAEAIVAALADQPAADRHLAGYAAALSRSPIMQELWRTRNWRQAFQQGMLPGIIRTQLQAAFGGRDWAERLPIHPARERLRSVASAPPLAGQRAVPALRAAPGAAAPATDGTLLLDKRTDVYLSKTQHEENQPAHMLIPDRRVCEECHVLYDAPCTKFCPGNVYAWEEGRREITISHANCLHPRACEPGCPFGNILWRPPPAGGGPRNRLT